MDRIPSGQPVRDESADKLRRSIDSLTLFRSVLDDPVGRAYRSLIESLADADVGGSEVTRRYRDFFCLMVSEAEGSESPGCADAWQNHLLTRILTAENAFSRRAESGPLERIGSTTLAAVRNDLDALQQIHSFDGVRLLDAVHLRDPSAERLLSIHDFHMRVEDEPDPHSEADVFRRLAGMPRWPDFVGALAEQCAARGLGAFREFRAFRWVRDATGGRLEGIPRHDPIHLDDLVGDAAQSLLLIENTVHFLAGLPANNILLYGDRGTGKSSRVKALLNSYAHRGLRMVEVQKEHLDDFPEIIRPLRDRRERFIVFVDDLSFEEHETHYKGLKALLEGSLEARPGNVLLYATSNRRHLIKERHSDRIHALDDDEIHLNDTTQEKLSLSDRFGITLTFLSPTQEQYLTIVRRLAERHEIGMTEVELASRALAWSTQRGSRSGRVARQFMDHLIAETEMARQGLTSPG